MRETCEKHVEKDPYMGSIAHKRYTLLIFKVHILFLFVSIRFTTCTINT